MFPIRIPAVRQAQQPPHASHSLVTESPASVQTCPVMKNLCLPCLSPALELRSCARREDQTMVRTTAGSYLSSRNTSCWATQPSGTWRTFMSLFAPYQVRLLKKKKKVSVSTFFFSLLCMTTKFQWFLTFQRSANVRRSFTKIVSTYPVGINQQRRHPRRAELEVWVRSQWRKKMTLVLHWFSVCSAFIQYV